MKKIVKALVNTALFFALVVCIKSISHAEYLETPYTHLPKKATIMVDETGDCLLGVATSTENISEVRSKNKKLKVNVVGVVEDDNIGGKWFKIELYSKKPGMYKFSYVYTSPSGDRQNKVVKVKVTEESPLKYVKIRGKKLLLDKPNYIRANKGKLAIRMKPGYKIKKILLDRYRRDKLSENSYYTVPETVEIKNNSVIDIPNQAGGFEFGGNYIHIKSTGIAAESDLRIIYIDKYSKEEMQIIFEIYKPLA